MKKNIFTNPGIQIDNSIRVTTNQIQKSRLFPIGMLWLINFISTIALIACFCSGLRLVVNYRVLLLTLVVITGGLTVGLELKKYGTAVIFIIYCVITGILIKKRKLVENGFYCLENAILELAAAYYGIQPVRFIVDEDPVESATTLMVAVTLVIALISAIELHRHYMRTLYIFSCIILIGCQLVLGVIPNSFLLLTVLLSIATMKAMDYVPCSFHQSMQQQTFANRIRTGSKLSLQLKSAGVVCFLLLILFGIGRVFISQNSYTKMDLPSKKNDLKSKIQNFSLRDTLTDVKDYWQNLELFQGGEIQSSGGLNSGKLGDVGEVIFSDEVALIVLVDKDVPFLYLKGYAGALYEGDQWSNISGSQKKAYEEILKEYGNEAVTGDTLLWNWCNHYMKGLNQFEIWVNYINANRSYMYAPYINPYLQETKVHAVGDQYFKSDTRINQYYFPGCFSIPSQETQLNLWLEQIILIQDSRDRNSTYPYSLPEEAYRNYVYEVYTRLPLKGLERLKALNFDGAGSGNTRTLNLIYQILTYFKRNTTYSLSPGMPKKGQDFAEYFLFDAKKGYCSHYATAATLILRNYGVPARYVEGYLIDRSSIQNAPGDNEKEVEVLDKSAHAWVEVYLDGIGWVPVEVTNGYSEEGISDLLPEIHEQVPSITPTKIPSPTKEVTPTNKITKAPTAAPTEVITKSPIPTSTAGITMGPVNEEPVESESGTKSRVPSTLICFALVVGPLSFVVMVLAIRYLTIRKQLETRGSNHNRRTALLVYYEQIERILAMMNLKKTNEITYQEFATMVQQNHIAPKGFDEVLKLGMKAGFGKEKILETEFFLVNRYYYKLRLNYLLEQKRVRRLYLKYGKVI